MTDLSSGESSADKLLSRGQTIALWLTTGTVTVLIGLNLTVGIGPDPLWWGRMAIAATVVLYLAVIGFKLIMIAGCGRSNVLRFDPGSLNAIADADLPPYTVLVPLYREATVLPTLVSRLSALDYPGDRLRILLLIEVDDDATMDAARECATDSRFELVMIPDSAPKTKPKACNIGLARAIGEFCVIYDAEDRPDPDQLRKAVLAFRLSPERVVCVQAELQYWNPWTNWLTRCFAAEYATNFSMTLHGMDRYRLAIPLGGTSNHFRTDALRALGGWDPYNVTEDADLGIRIARRGWDARMMDSVTEEEANARLGNWLRQRSRWIKGYLQTWLVHSRRPVLLWRQLGFRRGLAVHLTLGFATVTTLVNPVVWAMTILYLIVGPQPLEPLFPKYNLYGGVVAMLLGNGLMCYTLMLGCVRRGLFAAVRVMLTIPHYWGLMSVAAYKAMFQLLRPSKRHYWELTEHGLVRPDDMVEATNV